MSKMIYDYELVLSISSRHSVGEPLPNSEGHGYSRVSLGTVRLVDFTWFDDRGFWWDPDPLAYQPWFRKTVGWDEVPDYIVEKAQEETVKAFMASFGRLDPKDWLIEIEAYVDCFCGSSCCGKGREELYRL